MLYFIHEILSRREKRKISYVNAYYTQSNSFRDTIDLDSRDDFSREQFEHRGTNRLHKNSLFPQWNGQKNRRWRVIRGDKPTSREKGCRVPSVTEWNTGDARGKVFRFRWKRNSFKKSSNSHSFSPRPALFCGSWIMEKNLSSVATLKVVVYYRILFTIRELYLRS